MTSDGIKNSEWDMVKEYVAEICSLSAENKSDFFAKKKLFVLLEKLENQYGRLPSIISTRADYTEDVYQSLALNKEAYTTACEISDEKNMSLISGEITEIYLDELNELKTGTFWLSIFENCLSKYSDEYLNELFEDLSTRKRGRLG